MTEEVRLTKKAVQTYFEMNGDKWSTVDDVATHFGTERQYTANFINVLRERRILIKKRITREDGTEYVVYRRIHNTDRLDVALSDINTVAPFYPDYSDRFADLTKRLSDLISDIDSLRGE